MMIFSNFALCMLFLVAQMINGAEYGGCSHSCVTASGKRQRCSHKKIGEKYYYQFFNRTSWQDNRKLCENQGMEMVQLTRETISHTNQLIFGETLLETRQRCDPGRWLGGRAVERFAFLNYTYISDTEISVESTGTSYTTGDNACGYMTKGDSALKMGPCFNERYFVCRYEKGKVTASKEKKTWFNARERCLQTGGDLFYLKSKEAFKGIKHQVDSALDAAGITSTSHSFHIGAIHRHWIWSSGDLITASNWNSREPNNYYFGETCLQLVQSGEWNDISCQIPMPALCQGSPETEASTHRPLGLQSKSAIANKDEGKNRTPTYDGCYNSCLDTVDAADRCLYAQLGQYCYYLFERATNWHENLDLCQKRGLELVPASEESTPHIVSLELASPLSARSSCLYKYVWLDGKVENLNYWSFLNHRDIKHTTSSTQNQDVGRCGYIVTGDYSWKKGTCRDKRYFICRYDGNKVKPFHEQNTWFEARTACLHDGGDLLYKNRNEQIEILIKSSSDDTLVNSHDESFHIGLVTQIWRRHDGDYIRTSNWGVGHPRAGRHKCVASYFDGKWLDQECSFKLAVGLCRRRWSIISSVEEIPVSPSNQKPTSPNCLEDKAKEEASTQGLVTTSTLSGVFGFGCAVLIAYILIKRLQEKKNKHEEGRTCDESEYAYIDPRHRPNLPANDSQSRESNQHEEQGYLEPITSQRDAALGREVNENQKNTYTSLSPRDASSGQRALGREMNQDQGTTYTSLSSGDATVRHDAVVQEDASAPMVELATFRPLPPSPKQV